MGIKIIFSKKKGSGWARSGFQSLAHINLSSARPLSDPLNSLSYEQRMSKKRNKFKQNLTSAEPAVSSAASLINPSLANLFSH